jgi:membrane protease YdiL (CAAX protease family)
MRHALAFFLVLLVPVLDVWSTRRLKRSTDPNKKIRAYLGTVVLLWVASASAWALDRPGFFYPLQSGARLGAGFDRSFLYGMAIPLIFVLVIPLFLARWNKKFRDGLQKSMAKLSFVLPATSTERRLFVAVSLTAGICEETLYRGYLTHYLIRDWRLGVATALLLQAFVFGLAHCYQGLRGVFLTAFLGFWFAVLYWATGSLLMPMAIHAAVDLRILLFPSPALSPEKG